MTTFESSPAEPLSDTPHPRLIARERIDKWANGLTEDKNLEAQRLVVAGPLANQHQEAVKPRLDADRILRRSEGHGLGKK